MKMISMKQTAVTIPYFLDLQLKENRRFFQAEELSSINDLKCF